MVTLKEVAAAAQVSTVTASSVLSGVNRVRVSPATAERIHQIAKSMNYVPLAAARGLRTGKTRIIAFVASSHGPFHTDDVWHESLRGVSDLMWEREERLMLVMSRNREQELEIIRQMAYGRQVDGFIVQDSGDDEERLEMLLKSERPFVMMGGIPRPGVNTVSFDMRSFASDIAEIFSADNCGAAVVITQKNSDQRLEKSFFDFFGEWSGRTGIPCVRWDGPFVPDREWLASQAAPLNGKKLGVALMRGLLPETISTLEDAGLSLGEASRLIYVSTGEDVLLAPDGLTLMNFDNYTLGRRSARLLFSIVDNSKNPPSPENIIIPAAQQG